ncbi:hypothetical protein ASF32_19285 [Methylobacterium sp. Leaf91]|nr:hypothetical protein ASF32_19285 [Methylobacterium sp. Leaf91]
MPAPEAVPTAGTMPAPAAAPSASPIADGGFDFGGALKRFTDRGGSDLLVGLGTGLMSTPGFGNGLAAGFQNAQKAEQQRAVTGLAQAELGIKQRKLAQETAALSGNASVIKRAFPSLSDAEAASAGANSSLVTEAYKILRDPNHGKGIPPNYRQRADGQGYEPIPGSEADPATKESMSAAAARGAASVKPDEKFNLIPDAERAALGLPAGAYQRDSSGKISPINSTGTTINMGGEKAYDAEVGKSYAKQFTDFQTSGRNAGAKLNSLALMEQQMTKPDFYSGLGAENVKRLNQFLGVVGIKNPAAASPAEVVDALSNQVVMDQLGGSLGAGISDSDRKAIALIGPGIAKTPEGNRQLIGIYRSIAQREQEISQMARDYAKANGGRIDAGFDDRVAQFGLANPLFPAAQANATAQSDGKAGPVATPAAGTAPRGGTRRVFDPATGNFR